MGILFQNDTSRLITPIEHKLFPKMVACEVKRFGATGLEEWNGMCVLAGTCHAYLKRALYHAV